MQSKTLNRILIFGLALCAVLYAAGLNPHWRRLHSDGPVYLSLARSITAGKGYEHNYAPHGKYAPGLPVILAGVETITWVPQTLHSNFLPLNITLSLFGFGSIILAYLILIGKVIYQQQHPDFYVMEDVERLSDYDGICRWLRDNADPMDTTAAHDDRVVHYFSRVKTYLLNSGRGRRSAKWMAETIQRKDIRYIVQDEREPQATAFLDDLHDRQAIQLKTVHRDGRVTLWQVEFQ